MNEYIAILIAVFIDAYLGRGAWLWSIIPHPVMLIGGVIRILDRFLNDPEVFSALWLRALGCLVVMVFCIIALFVWLLQDAYPAFAIFLSIVLGGIMLSYASLIAHVRDVSLALDQGPEEGRKALAHIVGRDVEDLDSADIARGAIESCAENFNDGFVAPLFWFLLLGLPGILMYKMVNTADSMIGYKNRKYEDFGWAAARLDDVMNYVPARITGYLLCFVMGSGSEMALKVMRQDAAKHSSPNAGWPEAAIAGGLNIALAGPRVYDSRITNDPYLHAAGRKSISAEEIDEAIEAVDRAWMICVAFLVLLAAVVIAL